MRMESPLNQRLRRSPPDVVYTPIDVTSSGMNALTKSLAKEYGEHGITANAIAPLVKREVEKQTGPGVPAGALYGRKIAPGLDPDYFDPPPAITKQGTPQEVATAVAFFASEEAWFITGQVISVGGGFWM